VDVIALAVPAEDRLLLGLGRSGGPAGPRCRAPDSSDPDVSAPGRIEARRSRRSPNRIKQLRHSARIARTKAPRGRWHSARGRATRRGRGPCLARVSGTLARRGVPDPSCTKQGGRWGRPGSSSGASPAPDATCAARARPAAWCVRHRPLTAPQGIPGRVNFPRRGTAHYCWTSLAP
jgi:hypothetical protein